MSELTELERQVLDFERQWWKHRDAKAQAIKDHLDMSEVRYYQLLRNLINRPEALVHDPVTVKRLQRLQHTRRLRRAG